MSVGRFAGARLQIEFTNGASPFSLPSERMRTSGASGASGVSGASGASGASGVRAVDGGSKPAARTTRANTAKLIMPGSFSSYPRLFSPT